MSLCTVSRALHLFKEGETDNERLAALLIVANVLKSCDQSIRRKIFNGVGFEFINRLIYTDCSQSTQDPEPFYQVAVAILSSYCMDEELLLHPQLTSKVPQLNKFITSSVSSSGLLSDSLHCLLSLATVAKGRTYLWQYNTLFSLVQCIINHQSVYDISKSVIVNLLSDTSQITANIDMILKSIEIICEQVKLIHTEFKFTLCQLLTDILNICGEYIVIGNERRSSKWLNDVSIGLRDILQSKLDSTHRSIGLILVSCLCQLYGPQWTITTSPKEIEKRSSFLLLIVNLVCVEVNMLSIDDATPNLLLLLSCFSIIEIVISLMAETEDIREHENDKGMSQMEERKDSLLTEENLLQLHSTLLEGLTNIVHFLKSLDHNNQLFIPSVRVLGAWLAEDSLSLSSEVTCLLPSLLKLCERERVGMIEEQREGNITKELEEKKKEDIVKFLLPGIGHLIEEDRLRLMLLDNRLVHILLIYTHSLIKRLSDVSVQSQLEMCLTVVLNVYTKSEREIRVMAEWSSWIDILSELLKNKYVQSHCSLLILTVSLYLSIWRYNIAEGDPRELSTDIIDIIIMSLMNWLTCFISEKNSLTIYNNDIILLVLEELSSLVQVNSLIKHRIKSSSSYSSLKQYLTQSTPTMSSNLMEVADVFNRLDNLFLLIEE